MRKAIGIFTADWHLTPNSPICRTDEDWLEVIWDKLGQIDRLANQHQCPIYVAGDVFHKWTMPLWFITELIKRQYFWRGTPGNHDLLGHNNDKFDQSALGVLTAAGIFGNIAGRELYESSNKYLIRGYGFDKKPTKEDLQLLPKGGNLGKNIALCHFFSYVGEKPWPGCEESTAESLLPMFEGFDLVVLGDNHKKFQVTNGKTTILSPGSLFRLTAAQMDHEPAVWVYYDDGTLEEVSLMIDPDAVNRDHIDVPEGRKREYEGFAQGLVTGIDQDFGDEALNFKVRVDRALKASDVEENVKTIIKQCTE